MTSATTHGGRGGPSSGTARGAAHVARGLANQDSVESQVIDAVGGTVVAVADGHGHDRHFRSATGSRLATRTACAVVAGLAGETPASAVDRRSWPARCATRLPQAIVDEWRAAVAARHRRASVHGRRSSARSSAAGDGPEIPYGSTLLVALSPRAGWSAPRSATVTWSRSGRTGRRGLRSAGDDLLDGHRTTSLCQSGAVAVLPYRRARPAVRSRCSPCCSAPTGTATPRPRSRGSRRWPGTSRNSPSRTTTAGSPAASGLGAALRVGRRQR